MKPLKKTINTLAIIPQLNCTRLCDYCYERKKEYKVSLSQKDFSNLIKNTIKEIENLKEIMIDINEGFIDSETQFLEFLPNNIPIIVTTTPTTLPKFLKCYQKIKINISIHNPYDLKSYDLLNQSVKDRVGYLCIMFNDFVSSPELQKIYLRKKPIYIMIDKFSNKWINFISSLDNTVIINKLKILQLRSNITIDNCLLTYINNLPCPAYTQLNIYRDGSKRQCPYSSKEDIDITNNDILKSKCFMIKERTI